MESSISSPADTLQARYCRVLSFGDVLDESMRLFRQHWITFALISAASLLPTGLFDGWQNASGLFDSGLTVADALSGRLAQASGSDLHWGALVASSAVSVVFSCIWAGAVTTTTETYLRGAQPRLPRVYQRAGRRFLAVLVGTLWYLFVLSVLAAIGVVLLVAAVVPGLAGIVPGTGLLVWWLRPAARRDWLKWLIIVCTPFGLLMYFGTRWSMYVAATVLENLGPLASLHRSAELVNHQVIRVLSILTVGNLVVGVLTLVPQTLISIPFTISSGLLDYASMTEAVISEASKIVLRILFQSIGAIVYTLLFVDLRNRREGTDMAERLISLEALQGTPDR